MGLALKPDVHFCITNHTAVFLDLTADQYFCLPPDTGAALERALHVPLGEIDAADQDALCGSGLFVPSTDPASPPISATCCARPCLSAMGSDRLFTQPLQVLQAMISQALTAFSLQGQTLSQTVARLRRRKATQRCTPMPKSREVILALANAFLVTRRIIPTQDRCVPRSVALIDFLAGHGVSADLVVGVRMQPFAAHAWVQIEDTVVNDYLDEVLVYTAILVV